MRAGDGEREEHIAVRRGLWGSRQPFERAAQVAVSLAEAVFIKCVILHKSGNIPVKVSQ